MGSSQGKNIHLDIFMDSLTHSSFGMFHKALFTPDLPSSLLPSGFQVEFL